MVTVSRNRNRTIMAIAIVAVLAGIAAVGLSGTDAEPRGSETRVVASFYPLAYMAEQIGGDKVTVSTLIPPGSEVHSWQPSISDIASAEDADMIIYLGAGLDQWVEEDVLASIDATAKTVVEASEGIRLLETTEQEEDHGHEEGDPHLWVSPHTALMLAENIAEALMKADPEDEEYYTQRWTAFEQTLRDLDDEYSDTLSTASGKSFFVTHSAYGYVADRYGLKQHGIIGLSADEQPSTGKISEIVEEMTQEGSYVIYVDPVYSDAYAQTLKAELEARTGGSVQILELYLMVGPVEDMDYLDQLEANLNNLARGLVE
jgi:zinc transport system substrate-binding protein